MFDHNDEGESPARGCFWACVVAFVVLLFTALLVNGDDHAEARARAALALASAAPPPAAPAPEVPPPRPDPVPEPVPPRPPAVRQPWIDWHGRDPENFHRHLCPYPDCPFHQKTGQPCVWTHPETSFGIEADHRCPECHRLLPSPWPQYKGSLAPTHCPPNYPLLRYRDAGTEAIPVPPLPRAPQERPRTGRSPGLPRGIMPGAVPFCPT